MVPCHNGEISELNLLNSSTGQGPFQNKLKKVSAMLNHNGEI